MPACNNSGGNQPVRDALEGLHFFSRFAYSFSVLGYRQRRFRWKDFAAVFRDERWLVSGASGGIGHAIAAGAAEHGAKPTGYQCGYPTSTGHTEQLPSNRPFEMRSATREICGLRTLVDRELAQRAETHSGSVRPTLAASIC